MRPGDKKQFTRLTWAALVVAMNTLGCTTLASLWGHQEPSVQWPTTEELATLQPLSNEAHDELNGQAALAAAGALRETLRLWTDQGLFEGCATPALGLGAVVYAWQGTYYVHVTQRFDRCGGKRFRMLDWWESFAVSPDGRVLARRPQGFTDREGPSGMD